MKRNVAELLPFFLSKNFVYDPFPQFPRTLEGSALSYDCELIAD